MSLHWVSFFVGVMVGALIMVAVAISTDRIIPSSTETQT